MSMKCGKAPACEIASTVAMKVLGTVITTSPGATPAAIKANRRASVPLLTPTQWSTSQNLANSHSNSSTSGPPTNSEVLSARFKTATRSSSISACNPVRSRNGTLKAEHMISSSCDRSQKSGRIANNDHIVSHVLSDNGPGANNGVLSYRHVGKNGCS